MKPKILITAANGNTGFPAAKEMLKLGFPIRAFVRNPNSKKAKELKSLGAEIFVGDIQDIRDVRQALKVESWFIWFYLFYDSRTIDSIWNVTRFWGQCTSVQ